VLLVVGIIILRKRKRP